MTSPLLSTFGGEEVKCESAGRRPWARGWGGGRSCWPVDRREGRAAAAPALAACVPPGRAWGKGASAGLGGKAMGYHILSWTSRTVTPRVGGPRDPHLLAGGEGGRREWGREQGWESS